MSNQKELAPWLIALNELRAKSKMTDEQIAEGIKASKKSITRLFNGEAKKPDFFFVTQVIRFLGGSVSEILGEGGAYIVSQEVVTMQAQYEELKISYERLLEENDILRAKNAALTDELLNVVNYFINTNQQPK